MSELPTVAQVRAFLEHLRWKPVAPLLDGAPVFSDGTVVWWQTPGGCHVVIPGWPDDDTRLLEHSSAIRVIADATSRTLEQTVADILANVEDFDGCSPDCRPRSKPPAEWAHTLVWGRCAYAEDPEPGPVTVDFFHGWDAKDGQRTWGSVPIPLEVFAPWVTHLPTSDQWDMVEEVADANADERPGIVAQWRLTAEQLADPTRRAVLLGEDEASSRG